MTVSSGAIASRIFNMSAPFVSRFATSRPTRSAACFSSARVMEVRLFEDVPTAVFLSTEVSLARMVRSSRLVHFRLIGMPRAVHSDWSWTFVIRHIGVLLWLMSRWRQNRLRRETGGRGSIEQVAANPKNWIPAHCCMSPEFTNSAQLPPARACDTPALPNATKCFQKKGTLKAL